MYISRTLLERTCRNVRHFLTHNLKLELRLQEVGSQKFPLFVNHHKVENVDRGGVGGQKKTKTRQRSL